MSLFPEATYIGLPESYKEVNPDQVPSVVPWKFPLLEKKGNNEVVYIWQIGFDGESAHICNGPITTTKVDSRKIELNSSGKDIMTQAHQDILTKYRNKIYEGYVIAGSRDNGMVKGMKGVQYKQGCIKHFPVAVSQKLDGVRLLCRIVDGKLICVTYLNRKITHLKHIEREVFAFLSYLPPYSTLDAELYCHGMNFREIVSAVKTWTKEHKDVEKISYYIFDIHYEENPCIEKRQEVLTSAYNLFIRDGYGQHLKVIPNYIANSHEEIVAYKNYFISQGYEGVVIKYCGQNFREGSKEYNRSRYKTGKSNLMYKLKDFIDEEGIVVGVESAKGNETGAALLLIKDQFNIITPIRFGTILERKQWMKNPNLVIGRPFTFKYHSRGDGNAPIQPTGKEFRDYE